MPRARPLQLPHPLHSLHPLHLFRLCAVLAVAAPLLAAAGPRYTVTAVAGQDSFARGINNLGQVVGSISVADSYHAFVYAGGSLTDLGTFGGETSTAFAINDAGQVVGTSYSYSDTPTRGFLYSGGTTSTIQAGAGSTFAYGINNAGVVAGAMTVTTPDGDFHQHAYTWASGSFSDLGTLPGGDGSRAFAINGRGEVVGAAANTIDGVPNFPENPFVYRNGTMTDMGSFGGIWSNATSINDAGQVVGYAGIYFGSGSGEIYSRTAFLYDGGVMRDLGGLAPYRSSDASDINNLGQIVGSAGLADGSAHGFLYENGAMIDLNALIDPASGWTIQDAAAINDLQQIAANACRDGICQAVRLDLVAEVPEPSSFALVLAGLGLGVGFGFGAPALRARLGRPAFRRPAGRRPG